MYAFWLLIIELSQLFWRYIYYPIEKSGLESVAAKQRVDGQPFRITLKYVPRNQIQLKNAGN